MVFDLDSPAAREWHYYDDVRAAQTATSWNSWRHKAELTDWFNEPLIAARTWNYLEGPQHYVRLPLGVVDYYRAWPEAGPQPELVAQVKADCANSPAGRPDIRVPLVIYTDGVTGVLAEGNHRLAVAKELRLTGLPVAIVPNRMHLPGKMAPRPLEPQVRAVADVFWQRHNNSYARMHEAHRLERFSISGAMHVYCSCGARWMREVH
jgi:hypothetical protein